MSLPASTDHSKPFSCPICKTRFALEGIRNFHVNLMHENADSFKSNQNAEGSRSDKSSETVKKTENLTAHQTTVKKPENLIAHQTTVTEQKPFCCKICPKRFTSSQLLRYHHLDVHAEKTFKCKKCGKAFGRERGLKQHLLVTHLKEKPVQCEVCPKKFASQEFLRRHHLDCHAERFKCDYCGQGFGSERVLQQHLQTHSDNRPFKCGKCGESFKYSHHLKRHLARHSNVRRISSSEQSLLVKGKNQERFVVNAEQPGCSSGSSTSDLKVRSQTLSHKIKVKNYLDVFGHKRSGGHLQSRHDEPSESDGQTSKRGGLANGAVGGGNEEKRHRVGDKTMRARKARTESRTSDAKASHDPDSQRRIKRDRDSSSRSGNDIARYASRNPAQSAGPKLVRSSERGDQAAELPLDSRTMAKPKLKLVFDVEYRAPD